jgi:hypothetical protein
MAKVKNASRRARGTVASGVQKTVAPAKKDTSNKSGLGRVPRNDVIGKNPRTRKVRKGDIAKVARKYAARAVERIAEIMESDNNREALAAAFHLLDRAYGKPAGLDEKNNMNEVMLGLRESLKAKLARLSE